MTRAKSIAWIIIFMLLTGSAYLFYGVTKDKVDSLDYGDRSACYTYFFQGQYFEAGGESEEVVEKPVLTKETLPTFTTDFEEYYNTVIPFRKLLIRLKSSIDYYLFEESSNPKVVVGSDDWLFYRESLQESLVEWSFTEQELAQIAENLTITQNVLKSYGIDFVLFIAPQKEEVYSQYLPEFYGRDGKTTAAEQVVAYLQENTDIKVVYPREELKEAAETKGIELYHKNDTHWNYAGAYIASEELAKALGRELIPFDDITAEPVEFMDGDLTKMLSMPGNVPSHDYMLSNYGESQVGINEWNYGEWMNYYNGAGQGNLLMIRDSYGSAMTAPLSALFANSYYIYRGSYAQPQIFNRESTVVVAEYCERLLGNLRDFKVSMMYTGTMNDGATKTLTVAPAVINTEGYTISIHKAVGVSKGDGLSNEELSKMDSLMVNNLPLAGGAAVGVPAEETGIFIVEVLDANGQVWDRTEIDY